jgi:cellulose synthase/poly-beta-1,6-N-acetylglucosamine synthase-like glycosyltransferase
LKEYWAEIGYVTGKQGLGFILAGMITGEKNNKVSIIVVNWNGERFLKDCLRALLSQSYTNCEIILVDNGSFDNSVRFARENFPEVKIVALSGGAL